MLVTKNGKEIKLNILSGERAVSGALECLRRVYGDKDNYIIPGMLEPEWMKNEIREGKLYVFTAITDNGQPIGTLSAKRNRSFEESIDISSLAVVPEYNGFGLGDLLTAHVVSECEKAGHSLFYSPIVMWHSITGKIYEKNGFVPTGFLFGFCDAGKHLAELNLTSEKHSVGLYIRHNRKIEGLTIHVPEYIKPFAKEVYASLGVSPTIKCSDKPLERTSVLKYEQDEYHKVLYIDIRKCADDLAQKISLLEREHKDALQTYFIFVNLKDPGAVRGFEVIKELGYEFSGFKPLYAGEDVAILTKKREVVIDYSEMQMTPALKSIFERVRIV